MKKMLVFLIVCALCVSLIACSQPAQTETTEATEATTLPTENTAPFDWGSALDSTGSGCAMENVGNE